MSNVLTKHELEQIREMLKMVFRLSDRCDELEARVKELEQPKASPQLEALKALALRRHYSCEDPWYSCPKSDDGCANEDMGTDCSCGVDEHNAEVERVFALLKAPRP